MILSNVNSYSNPFALGTPRGRKCGFWDAAGSAIVGAGSSLLGGLFGSSNNKSSNKTNLKIARETNAMQRKMFDDQLQFNYDMWKENNAYNRPDQQVARMKAAGLNPYLQGNVGSGTSSSAAQGATPPTLHTPTMQSYDPTPAFNAAGSILADSMLKASQVANVQEDTKGKSIDNITRLHENLARVDQLVKDAHDKYAAAGLKKLEAGLMRATWDETVNAAALNNEESRTRISINNQTARTIELDNILKEMHNKNYPREFAAQMAETWSRVALNRSGVRLNDAQIAKLAQDVIESEERVNNIKIDTKTKEGLKDALVRQAKATADRQEEEAENVELFGVPNPSYTVDNGLGLSFGLGNGKGKGNFGFDAKSEQVGYGTIVGAKENAKKVRDSYKNKKNKK